jgi:hypothetical protein
MVICFRRLFLRKNTDLIYLAVVSKGRRKNLHYKKNDRIPLYFVEISIKYLILNVQLRKKITCF